MPTPPSETLTVGTSTRGTIAGYVLRLVREQLGLAREELSECFRVSPDTLAGWETGRRPLTAVSTGQLLVHRYRLLHLGARPELLDTLDRGLEADTLLGNVLDGETEPLGAWVMQRPLVETLAWPLTGVAPEPIRALPPSRRPRRGPVPAGPELGHAERRLLFANLRRATEYATAPGDFLLRRQALYLSGYDDATDVDAWSAEQQRHLGPDDWLSRWLTARSLASVATRYGDTERTDVFVESLDGDDRAEAANLAYWAYWIGETHTELSDDFMATGKLGVWEGRRLLTHLVNRMHPGHGYLALYVHTVWALLMARPHLLASAPDVAAALADRVEKLLDGPEAPASVRRELDGIRYAIRLAQA
ncbi:helix-turn-helix domain-containing protein [Nocardiopsis alba]|uniref:helix-turn-helix domain-containing protein n=1 Tax=Nocardiopsis alba TaxID=53437 RepID=UPI0033F670E2